jgi:hypothetical protein
MSMLLAFVIDIRIFIHVGREPSKPQPKAAVKQVEPKEGKWREDPFVKYMREYDRWERDYFRVGGY